MQTEALEILIAHEQRVVGAANLQLEVSKSIERVRPAPGRDAAAVLGPRAGVLDVPELPVRRRHPRDRGKVCNASRGGERGDDQTFQESHRVTILRRMKRAAALLVLYIFCATSLTGQDRQAQDDTAKPAEGF